MGFSGVLFISGTEMSLAPFSRLAVLWSLGSGSPPQFGGLTGSFAFQKFPPLFSGRRGVKFVPLASEFSLQGSSPFLASPFLWFCQVPSFADPGFIKGGASPSGVL